MTRFRDIFPPYFPNFSRNSGILATVIKIALPQPLLNSHMVSQISKNEPVNDQKPAAYLPIVLKNNKNNNKCSLTVKF